MTVSKHTGTITQGSGNARKHYRITIPKIAEYCSAVANCGQFGTINVELDEPLDNSRADYWTPEIAWNPVPGTGLEENRVEAFGLTKIKFEYPLGGEAYDAWIVLPEGHTWTYNGEGVEVIADVDIPGIAYGRRCALHLDHTPSSPPPSWLGKRYSLRRT